MNPLLMPLVAVQGARVRRNVEVLPEASGPTTGLVLGGDGDPLRVGVIGESTAAGCGSTTHDEAFAGALSRALAAHRGRDVAWQVVGQNGATLRRVRHRLIPRLTGPFDVVVLLIGVNDVLVRRSPREWAADLFPVLDGLTAHADRVIMAGVPPFESFPALPSPLSRYLGERGRALDAASRDVVAQFPTVRWVSSDDLATADRAALARDGFHPSPSGYATWATAVADAVPEGG